MTDTRSSSAVVEEVLPGVWRTECEMYSTPYLITTNAYVVIDGADAVMIDTAWWWEQGREHLDALEEVAIGDRTLRSVVLTHAHRDHSGNAESVVGELDSEILLLSAEQPTVSAMSDFQGLPDAAAGVEWYRRLGFPSDVAHTVVDSKLADHPLGTDRVRWIEPGHVVAVGDRRLRVIASPGHTPGHACVWDEENRILFSGDALLPRGNGNPHVTVRPFTSADPLSDYVHGLEEIRLLGAEVCLPGHGRPVTDVDGLIQQHLDYVQVKTDAVRTLLTDRPMTVFEVAQGIGWRGGRKRFTDLVNDELFLAAGDTLARVRRLAAVGDAIREVGSDGVETYRSARSS
ncbi:hypothetical protein ASD65_10010 [Microbacterium sp. Root61]|uniref:MBL fold metallo-hydrolase n=1 Tax=Microbacterium sp. Root61 TaxID=1736570 RepID=UPI0006F5B472|nr:MBL fold metallo-hydrolase [Microbacterium sp. Root61]KRA24714.1 hypothetical protein ASD65_10010 [Microbacterium sp. Root61]